LGESLDEGDIGGCRFPVEGVISPSTSSTGENPVHILDKRRGRYRHRSLPNGVAIGTRLGHDVTSGRQSTLLDTRSTEEVGLAA
jgi:hypothetical protein